MNKPFIPFSDPDKVAAAEYAANMKQVAQETINANTREIDAIEQQLQVLTTEPFEYMRLPILSHTFIILDAPHRFELMPIFMDLLHSLKQRATSNHQVIEQAISTAKDVRKDDTLDNYPLKAPFDTSQFLTQYFTTSMANGLVPNHREKKLLEKIRQHIIRSYRQTMEKKKQAIERSQDILSRKLYGE